MPIQEQSIALNNMDKETALAVSYEAMKNLRWTIQFAGPDKILGKTLKKWNSNGEQIIIDAADGQLTVSSEMVNGESFDIPGNNKKNIAAFIKTFELAKSKTEPGTLEQNKAAIDTLRSETITAAELDEQQALEVNEAMNLSGSSNLYVTYTIIGLNVLVFILMVINGAGLFEANSLVHISWGSNYSPLTMSGDWWRLLTNVFIHFGIIHVAMNMYCLYAIGSFLEPMLGKGKYITAYLCTGVLASLVSLWWHKEGVNSAGASGAVFGMYGLFLALLTTSLIPKHVRQPLLQSIGVFVAFNLFYGLKGGIDNAAHIGGLISGFVIGYLYVYGIKKEKQEQKTTWMIPAVLLITIGITYAYLQQNNVSDTERKEIVSSVKAASYKDNDKFNLALTNFSVLEEKALAPLKNDSLSSRQLVQALNETKPLWNDAEASMKSTMGYNISPEMHQQAARLIEYTQLRRKENEILAGLNASPNENEAAGLNRDLEATQTGLQKLLDELKGL